jgi:hypothetical protein
MEIALYPKCKERNVHNHENIKTVIQAKKQIWRQHTIEFNKLMKCE